MSAPREELIAAARTVADTVAREHAASVDKEGRFPAESIAALKAAKLLGAYVPKDLGGEGCSLHDLSAICHALGQACASTAMVFAMHQIQVACLVHHGLESPFIRGYLAELTAHQYLLASATSEAGIGGNTRTSSCAVEASGNRFQLKKNAIVISYAAYADGILVTARKNAQASASDQVLVIARKQDWTLEQTGGWDTLGMRGTCSNGYLLTTSGSTDLIVPVPYADISALTMLPVAHLTWASLWLGIATDAVNRARRFVRGEARKTPGVTPPGALRLAEVTSELQLMRANLIDLTRAYSENLGKPDVLTALPFAIRMNNLKIGSSKKAVEVVNGALQVCGIHGYRNDTPYSLGRHLRDAHSAALMVSNERILGNTATLLLASKEDVGL